METKSAQIQWGTAQLQKADRKDVEECFEFLKKAFWAEELNDSTSFEELYDPVENIVIYKVHGPIDWVEEFKTKFMKVATL